MPPLRHPPEHKRFLQLRNRARIREISRNGVKGIRPQPPAVQIIAMAEVAVLEENLAPSRTYLI